MALDKATVFTQTAGCLLEHMDDDSLLFNPHTGATLHLNSPSALIWQLCDGSRNVGELIAVLDDEFPAQAAQIAEDVETAILEMQQQGVLSETE